MALVLTKIRLPFPLTHHFLTSSSSFSLLATTTRRSRAFTTIKPTITTGRHDRLKNGRAIFQLFRSKSTSTTTNSATAAEDELDEPIKFSTSGAAKWTANQTLGGPGSRSDMPAAQPLIVTLSVTIFMLYFFVLREESDIDEEIAKPLWQKVPGLERQQLYVVLEYNIEHGLPVDDIVERLRVIEGEVMAQEAKLKASGSNSSSSSSSLSAK